MVSVAGNSFRGVVFSWQLAVAILPLSRSVKEVHLRFLSFADSDAFCSISFVSCGYAAIVKWNADVADCADDRGADLDEVTLTLRGAPVRPAT